MNPILRHVQVAGAAAAIGRARCKNQAVPSTLDEELASERSESAAAGFAQGLHDGREEGLRAGHEEGLAQGRAEAARAAGAELEAAVARAMASMQEKERRLAALLASLQAAARGALHAAEEDMVALCFQAIGQMLGAAVVTEEGVQARVRTLLAERLREEILVAHLHPSDVALVEPVVTGGHYAGVTCVADLQVALGGCILRGSSGAIDARLETALDELKAVLLATRRQREAVSQ